MAAAAHACANCKAPLTTDPLPPPRPPTSAPEVVDDQFVVVLDALGGSDPFAAAAAPAPETAAEALARCLKEHRRGASDEDSPACARCCVRAAAAVDGRAADARERALRHARAFGEASLEPPVVAAQDCADRDAVGLALDRARREARFVGRQLDAARAEARRLEREEGAVLEAARALDGEADAFCEACDEAVGRCARRGRRDKALEVLRRRLAALDVDRAPFERLDAYVRSACERLAPVGDGPLPLVVASPEES